jgi:hypothetical protein
MTMPYKVGALEYDWDTPYHEQRVFANRNLKKGLIDRAFSDAVLYSGSMKKAMRYSVQQAICAAVTDETDLSRPCEGSPDISSTTDLFVVTHSLGSVMLFDALADMKSDSELAAARELVRHTKLIGMMANQLPLIALSRFDSPPVDGRLGADLASIGPYLDEKQQQPINIVAFSDVNDLLSYAVPETWQTSLFPEAANGFRFINYPVRNARWAILGIFANPSTAHGGYWDNRTVIRALTDGYDCGK